MHELCRPTRALTLFLAICSLLLVMSPFSVRPAEAGQVLAPTIDELISNPSLYYGQTVRLSGTVGEILGARTFTLVDQGILFADELLVVSSRPLQTGPIQAGGPAIAASDTVWVIGTVRPFDVAAFVRQLGSYLDDDRLEDWTGRPAIVASSVVPRFPGLEPSPLSVDTVTENPAAYYGQTVTVAGSIAEVFGARTFAIEDMDLLFGDSLLAVTARPLVDVGGTPLDLRELGTPRVAVTGYLRSFDLAAIEQELGLDLDDAALASWTGRPVMIAHSVVRDEAPAGAR